MLKINPYSKTNALPEYKQFPNLCDLDGKLVKDYIFFWDSSLKCYVVETTITNKELLFKMIERDVKQAKDRMEMLLADYTERFSQLNELIRGNS